ncbi:hypothetical protein T484DRAFT_3649722, partial [Baffinella frigidus]
MKDDISTRLLRMRELYKYVFGPCRLHDPHVGGDTLNKICYELHRNFVVNSAQYSGLKELHALIGIFKGEGPYASHTQWDASVWDKTGEAMEMETYKNTHLFAWPCFGLHFVDVLQEVPAVDTFKQMMQQSDKYEDGATRSGIWNRVGVDVDSTRKFCYSAVALAIENIDRMEEYDVDKAIVCKLPPMCNNEFKLGAFFLYTSVLSKHVMAQCPSLRNSMTCLQNFMLRSTPFPGSVGAVAKWASDFLSSKMPLIDNGAETKFRFIDCNFPVLHVITSPSVADAKSDSPEIFHFLCVRMENKTPQPIPQLLTVHLHWSDTSKISPACLLRDLQQSFKYAGLQDIG